MRRTVLAVLAVLGALVAPGTALGTDEVGATVSAERIPLRYSMDDGAINVLNRSTIPADITVSTSGGWHVDRDAFRLDPGETGTLHVTEAGSEAGVVAVELRGVGVTGTEASVLRFEVDVRHPTFTERNPWLVPLLAIVALAVCVLILARVRRRAP